MRVWKQVLIAFPIMWIVSFGFALLYTTVINKADRPIEVLLAATTFGAVVGTFIYMIVPSKKS